MRLVRAADIKNLQKEHGVSLQEAVSHLTNKKLKRDINNAPTLEARWQAHDRALNAIIDKVFPTLRNVK